MKLTKIAGAFALTAAMAMAAVPAFADTTEATNEALFTESTTNKATASTKVMASATNVNLTASIPTRVAVVIPSKGVGNVICPGSDVYKIVNKSTNKIYLNNVTGANGAFSLVTEATTQPQGSNIKNLAMKVTVNGKDVQLSTAGYNFQPTDAPEISINGELPLTLSGNVAMSSDVTLTTASLDAAITTITYTIGVTNSI